MVSTRYRKIWYSHDTLMKCMKHVIINNTGIRIFLRPKVASACHRFKLAVARPTRCQTNARQQPALAGARCRADNKRGHDGSSTESARALS